MQKALTGNCVIHTHIPRHCMMLSLHISYLIDQNNIDNQWLWFDTNKGTFPFYIPIYKIANEMYIVAF